jgi:hypothetical protein
LRRAPLPYFETEPMWEKLLEIFFGKALDWLQQSRAPRHVLARSFAHLYVRLSACQSAWNDYTAASGGNRTDLRRAWLAEVDRLSSSVQELRLLLDIHDPELLSVFYRYIIDERIAARLGDHRIKDYLNRKAGRKRKKARKFETELIGLAISIRQEGDYDIQEDQCLEVMVKLKDFMRDKLQLTPEELIGTSLIPTSPGGFRLP